MSLRLVSTKYSVFDLVSDASQTNSARDNIVIHAGAVGKLASINEVAMVALNSAKIILDVEINGDELAPGGVKIENFEAVASNKYTSVPTSICKAAVFARIISLLKSQAVRGVVIKYLVDILNAGIVPLFTDENKAGKQLVAIIMAAPFAFCNYNDKVVPIQDALNENDLNPISLSESEVATIVAGQFYVTGASCLIASYALNLVQMVDVVAALSCEAYGVCMEPFDYTNYDIARPHRSLINTANNFRLLLQSSKRVNTCTKEINESNRLASLAFHNIPQIHGPTKDAIASAIKALELEINSSENGPRDESNITTLGFDATPSRIIINNIASSMCVLFSASMARISSLDSTYSINNVSNLGLNDPVTIFQLVEKLQNTLNLELVIANKCLTELESRVRVEKEASENDNSVKKKGQNADGGDDENRKFKPEQDESNWTPEQKAKAEAKRKLKAEKAAAKTAAKEAKKGGATTIVFGTGTSQVRTYIANKCGGVDKINKSTLSSIRLGDISDAGFGHYCFTLLEALKSGGEERKPRIAKGARDFTPEQMRIREQVFATIRRVFKRHGGVEIDTPVFEIREVLLGKYGEDTKLIYDLADQGGDLLSLRYDLTVPFARFLAMNGITNIKRYHIAKVYRRDNPQLSRGRYREFYQCDFDIAGTYSVMVPDAEVITVATEILSDLPVGKFLVKLNHRRLLDAIFEISGVPASKFRPICSAVDKLDKEPWEEVRREMIEDKGLSSDIADRIGTYVLHSGRPKDLWTKLTSDKIFGDHHGANAAMNELNILFEYLAAMGSIDYVSFDLSLARGLDYYTGVIYEIVLVDGTSQVGSISAGGRYDNLVGMFSSTGNQTPCVGVSIGVERVFTIIEKRAAELNILQSPTIQVYIASIGAGMIAHRMKIANILWKANISAEYSSKESPKLKPQLDDVLERGIPYMIVFGDDEIKRGTVKVKCVKAITEDDVALENIVDYLQSKGCNPIQAGDLQLISAMM